MLSGISSSAITFILISDDCSLFDSSTTFISFSSLESLEKPKSDKSTLSVLLSTLGASETLSSLVNSLKSTSCSSVGEASAPDELSGAALEPSSLRLEKISSKLSRSTVFPSDADSNSEATFVSAIIDESASSATDESTGFSSLKSKSISRGASSSIAEGSSEAESSLSSVSRNSSRETSSSAEKSAGSTLFVSSALTESSSASSPKKSSRETSSVPPSPAESEEELSERLMSSISGRLSKSFPTSLISETSSDSSLFALPESASAPAASFSDEFGAFLTQTPYSSKLSRIDC